MKARDGHEVKLKKALNDSETRVVYFVGLCSCLCSSLVHEMIDDDTCVACGNG
jgi:hypothetical protein